VEQRVSNLTQGALCLVLLTSGLFLHVLNLIPRGVLAGLWYMGADALRGSTSSETKHPRRVTKVRKVRKSCLISFVAVQLLGFGAAFTIAQTIAAIGPPLVIVVVVPVRTLIIPRLTFTLEELATLDGPT
ncbi:hypothetical protein BDN67DRAFT_871172, partial [Paxillus ammoniavirescens]